MPDRADSLRARLVPALLTGLGGVFLAAGLLGYTNPAAATDPSPTASSPSAVLPSPSELLSVPPVSVGPTPSASGSAGVDRVATRIVIPALAIDLAIVKPPPSTTNDGYPYCNVAMYLDLPQFRQPGEGGVTYLFAHARTGMFLPLLDESKIDDGARLKGMLVQVYTSDDQLFLYAISEVRRHVLSLDAALGDKRQVLYLQTSEGPRGTPQKLQVIASPLSSGPADHADAHPTPHPLVCG